MQNAYNLDPNGAGGTTPALPGIKMASQPTGADFWDVGDADFAGQQLAPDQEFSELVEIQKSATRTHPAIYLTLALLLGVGGFFAYEIFVEDRNPLRMITQLWPSDTEDPAPKPKAKAHHKAVAKAAPAHSKALPKQAVAGNPYWSLPNKIVGSSPELGRFWSPEEEEVFRAGMAHRYTYQRHKTVQEVRKQRLRGSDVILWDAMQEKKFWTRGFAAIGLAEFNIEVSLQSLEGALTHTRSELVADFFERFIRKPNAGQAFVLRQVVRLLDEKGRLIVLRGIDHSHDSLRDLYMVAATKDPGKHVQRWVKDALLHHPVAPDHFNELLAVVDGKNSGNYLLTGGPAPKTPTAKKLAPGASEVATEEDIDKELEQFDEEGDVEFYDTDKLKAVNDKTDPQTFEYEE